MRAVLISILAVGYGVTCATVASLWLSTDSSIAIGDGSGAIAWIILDLTWLVRK